MRKWEDTTTGEIMTYDEIAENFNKYLKKVEPEVWEDTDVDDFIGFHEMCGDIREVK